MIVLAIMLALISITAFVILTAIRKGKDPSDPYDAHTRKTLGTVRWVVVGVAGLIFVAMMLIGGIRIMDQTEIGVVKTFGRIDHTIDGGLNFVNPLTDTVEVMDLRVHVRQAEFSSYTKDAQPVTGSVEYQYELLPGNAMNVASQFGSYEILETKLGAVVEDRVKVVFARYGAMTLLENRATLSVECTEEVRKLEETFPVHFTSVVVNNIDFSDAFEAAVEAKMQAEQNALRAENEKKEAITRAEQAREVARVNAEATVLAAQAEADALAITREALEAMPPEWIAQQYLEKWNGVLPQFMTGDSGTSLMITPNMGGNVGGIAGGNG